MRRSGLRICPDREAICRAAALLFGDEKAAPLAEVLEGKDAAASLPSQAVQPDAGSLLWWVDEDAASWLQRREGSA